MNINNVVVVDFRSKAVYTLIFLFPVLGMSMRHWISAIFTLLVLVSFTYLYKKKRPLEKQEQILLWILFLFFIVFIVSALMNGWTDRQTNYLGVEIRYLLAIPLYVMLKQLDDATTWLLRGCVIGGIVLGIQAYYDVEILNYGRANGIYSSNLIGPLATLMMFWLLVFYKSEIMSIYMRMIVTISILLSLYTVAMSGSRGSYAGFIILSCIWVIMYFKGKKAILMFLVISAILSSIYFSQNTVSSRINNAMSELQDYAHTERKPFECLVDGKYIDYKQYLHAVEFGGMNINHCMLNGTAGRFEMWHLSWMVFMDNPVWGIGRGNYEMGFDEYIEKGLVHPDVNLHGHPHDAYLELLVSKGLIGFVIFCSLLLYPLSRFIRACNSDKNTAMLGITLIVGFMVFSLTDASPFIKGNYLSVFLVFLACFFARLMRALNEDVLHKA